MSVQMRKVHAKGFTQPGNVVRQAGQKEISSHSGEPPGKLLWVLILTLPTTRSSSGHIRVSKPFRLIRKGFEPLIKRE